MQHSNEATTADSSKGSLYLENRIKSWGELLPVYHALMNFCSSVTGALVCLIRQEDNHSKRKKDPRHVLPLFLPLTGKAGTSVSVLPIKVKNLGGISDVFLHTP